MKHVTYNKMRILAIETSCDETSAAIIHVACNMKRVTSLEIKSNIVSSQVKLHAKYGGVYPELASREHVKNIVPVIKQALLESNSKSNPPADGQMSNQTQNSKLKTIHNTKYIIQNTIDAIAITAGPGLIGSLLVGVETAKTLAYVLGKPIYPINHVEGHIYANFVREISNFQFLISNQTQNSNDQKSKIIHNTKYIIQNTTPQFPLIALVVSGGHTSLILMKDHLKYKVIGETLDDAAGEAFDKVAKMLGLGYPGGPAIAAEAAKFSISNDQFTIKSQIQNSKNTLYHTPYNLHLPRPMIDSAGFDFSFSGLKTSVLYTLNKLKKPIDQRTKELVCKEFQDAVVETLVTKTIKAAKKYKVKSILLCGGVAANQELRENLKLKVKNEKLKMNVFIPPTELCTDNAAMIGVAAAYKIALGRKPTPWYNVNAQANLKLANSNY